MATVLLNKAEFSAEFLLKDICSKLSLVKVQIDYINPIRPGLFSRSPGRGGGGGLRGPDAKNQG